MERVAIIEAVAESGSGLWARTARVALRAVAVAVGLGWLYLIAAGLTDWTPMRGICFSGDASPTEFGALQFVAGLAVFGIAVGSLLAGPVLVNRRRGLVAASAVLACVWIPLAIAAISAPINCGGP